MKYVNISSQTMSIYDDIKQLDRSIRERFEKLERRIRKNEVISGFYESIYNRICDDDDYFDDNYFYITYVTRNGVAKVASSVVENNKKAKYIGHLRKSAESVLWCSRKFVVDYYPFHGYKDIKRKTSCNNKFCDSCQSAISQQRFERFSPVLETLQKNFDVAHIVFTIPNCRPEALADALDRMYDARQYIIRYLSGSKKIRGIDFVKYGFRGGVSSIEITRNEKEGTLHPHFHCAFVFNKNSGVFSSQKFINTYSFEHGEKVRLFNKFEILLQKVWRLKIDGFEVNRHTIENLSLGYDVICERRSNFKEVFKYATKGIVKYNKDVRNVLGYFDDFYFLDRALFKRRLVQTYGCLRCIPNSDEVNQSSEDDMRYQKFVEQLRSIESPIEQIEFLNDLTDRDKSENVKYFSCHNMGTVLGADDEK